MKMKNLFQYRLTLLWCRFFQVHPKKEIGVGQQGWHQKHIKILGVQTSLSGKRKRANHSSNICMPSGPLASLFFFSSSAIADRTYSITPRIITSAILK